MLIDFKMDITKIFVTNNGKKINADINKYIEKIYNKLYSKPRNSDG